MATIRLLIVEDHDFFRRTIALLLETEARIVVVGSVASGEQALGLVDSLRPDIVLLDLNLPELSGLATIEQIGARADAPAILVLTGAEDVESVVRAFAAGVRGYLRKEMVGDELLLCAILTVVCGGIFLDATTFALLQSTFSASG
jgi:DNA-binding NarL/FixJ family response regulator